MARKKTAKKPAAKKRPVAKKKASSSRAPAGAPRPVNTGRGPSASEIGASLVASFNAGKWDEPCKKWWAQDVTSVEGIGLAWTGKNAALAKNADWYKENRPLGGTAEGPFVGASGFAVKFHLEVEEIASGKRTIMDEVGVYTVKDGRIIREEFMYGPATVQRASASAE